MVVTTEKGEETRARILREARGLFAEHGYLGTSTAMILQATGLTKGGLYFHFPSKAALALAVVADGQARTAEVTMAHVRGERGIDDLWGIVRGAFELCSTPELSAVTSLCAELTQHGEEGPALEPVPGQWRPVVVDILSRAQAEGDLAADLDVQEAGTLLIATFFGLKDMADGDPAVTAAHERAYRTMVCRLLGVAAPA